MPNPIPRSPAKRLGKQQHDLLAALGGIYMAVVIGDRTTGRTE
jgi:hypothetical protein